MNSFQMHEFKRYLQPKTDVFPGNPGVISRPRIATNGVNLTDPSNYTVVIRYTDVGSSHFIQTYSVWQNTSYGPTVINDNNPDLTATSPTCLVNDDPVVTYAGSDGVFVAWTYNEDCLVLSVPPAVLIQKDMIVKVCDLTGAPYLTTYLSFPHPTSSVDETVPAIAGRYSSNNKALYTCFHDAPGSTADDIWYKYHPIGSSSLRPISQGQLGRDLESGLILYPNQTRDLITLRSSNKERINSTLVFDLSGRVVLHHADNEATVTLGTASLEPGAYLVQCLLNSGKRLHARLNVVR